MASEESNLHVITRKTCIRKKEEGRKAAKTPTVVSSQISLEAEKHTLLSCTARTGSSESRPRTKRGLCAITIIKRAMAPSTGGDKEFEISLEN